MRDTSTLDSAAAEIGHRTRGAELLIDSNLNTDSEFPGGNKHNKAIAAAMEKEEL